MFDKTTNTRCLQYAASMLGLWLASTAALAEAELLPPFTARYKLEKAGFDVVESTVTLEQENGEWHYRSESEPLGVVAWFFSDHRIVEESRFRRDGDGVRPLEYRYTHHGSEENRDLHYEFDWENQRARIDDEGEHKRIELPEGALDNFTLQLVLVSDLAEGREAMSYPVISKGSLKTYRFSSAGEETVETPLGEYDTVKLQRVKDDEERTTYTTWYAPKLDYLPVRVERTENGDRVLLMRLVSIQWH